MQQYAVCILFYCNIALHVSGAVHAYRQEYIKLKLQPLVQVIWSCSYQRGHVGVRWLQDHVTCTSGCNYRFMYS